MKLQGIVAGAILSLLVAVPTYQSKADIIDTSVIRASIIKAGIVASGVIGNPFGGGGAVADFFTLNFNLGTIVPDTTETVTTSFTRATVASIDDALGREGVQISSGEVPFAGMDRIENLFGADVSAWGIRSGVTITDVTGSVTPPSVVPSNSKVWRVQGTGAWSLRDTVAVEEASVSFYARAVTTSAEFRIATQGGAQTTSDLAITEAWTRLGAVDTSHAGVTAGITRNVAGDDADIYIVPQAENVTGKPNKAPGQYTSVGVESAPYFGANVDGVRYSPYHNPRYVDSSNVVQNDSATGTLISSSNNKFANVQAAGDYYAKASPNITTIDGLTVKVKVAPEDVVNGSAQRFVEIPTADRDQVLRIEGANGYMQWSDGTASATATTAPTWVDGEVTWLIYVIDETAETVSFYQAFTFGEPEVADYVALTADVAMSASPSSGAVSSISFPSATSPAIGRYYNAVLSAGANTDTFNPADTTGWSANGNAYIFSPPDPAIRISEAYTNRRTYSNQIDQWTATNVTVDTDVGVASDGTTTLDRVNITAGSGLHDVTLSGISGLSFDTDYAYSIDLKDDGATYAVVAVRYSNSNYAAVVVNMLTGAITQTSDLGTTTLTSSTVRRKPDGLLRVTVVAQSSDDGSFFTTVSAANSATPTLGALGVQAWAASGGEDFFAGWAQVTDGSEERPYIATGASAVARNADDSDNDGFDLQMPVVIRVDASFPGDGANRAALELHDGSTDNRILLYQNAANNILLNVRSGASDVVNTIIDTADDTIHEYVLHVEENNVYALVDGVKSSVDTSAAAFSSNLTTLDNGAFQSDSAHLNGDIPQVRIYNSATADEVAEQ